MQFLPVVNTFSLALLLSVHTMAHSWQTRTWGMLIVRSCMLVGVCRVRFLMRRPDCTLHRRRMMGMLLAVSSPTSFLCGFMPLYLQLTTGLSQWWAPTVSVWGLLLTWLTAYSRLCKVSLQLIFVTISWSTTNALSFLEVAEEDCFGHA